MSRYELFYNLLRPKRIVFEAKNENDFLDCLLEILQKEEGEVFKGLQKIVPLIKDLNTGDKYKLNALGTAFIKIET